MKWETEKIFSCSCFLESRLGKCFFPLKINCTFFFLPPDEIWEGAKYSWNCRCRRSLSFSFSLSHHLIALIIARNVKWLIYLSVVLKSPMSSLALKGKSLRRRPHRQSKGPVGVKWSGTLSLFLFLSCVSIVKFHCHKSTPYSQVKLTYHSRGQPVLKRNNISTFLETTQWTGQVMISWNNLDYSFYLPFSPS